MVSTIASLSADKAHEYSRTSLQTETSKFWAHRMKALNSGLRQLEGEK